MIVADYIVPFDLDEVKANFQKGSIADTMLFSTGMERIEDLPLGSIVLFFIEKATCDAFAKGVVSALGALYSSCKSSQAIMLGNLITSGNDAYNAETFSELVVNLQKGGHFPVAITSSSFYIPYFCEILGEQQNLGISLITSSFNSCYANGKPTIFSEVKQGLKNNVSGFSILGYQNYFTSPDSEKNLEGLYLQKVRLGALRKSMRIAEAAMRDSNILFVDSNALRRSDFTAAASQSPNGMYAEEYCQLMRYAGFSDKLNGLYIGGFDLSNGTNAADEMLIAQGIWHFFEGYSSRKQEIPAVVDFPSKQFFVELGEQQPVTLHFMQSIATERWWLFIPNGEHNGCWIACDEDDYEKAKHHELPYRWIVAQNIFRGK